MSSEKRDEPRDAHVQTQPVPDAGLKTLDHYARRLPPWRYLLRQRLIPFLRWETDYLAYMQKTCRTPMLDSYFAITANLGTHTFFMTALPICFWCGYPEIGRALVHMLALGVYWSGVVKDMLCLPRPLSPPLQRITMSGSAALEYGFPSTHTTNAVSVAIFCLWQLKGSQDSHSANTYAMLQAGCYCYAISITFGRLYCGMHGFSDVVIGGILGALIAGLEIGWGPAFDSWIFITSPVNLLIIIFILALAVRFHPEPADNCPCFDDSVAFTGVLAGIEGGTWHYAQPIKSFGAASPFSRLYTFSTNDWAKGGARVVSGIIIIFVWRAVMKPLLLRSLPPIFRFVEHYGLTLPRRYFTQARDYKRVPPLRKDDNVLPSASELPNFISNLRHPRKRAVSIGPQSEADAREFIASREQKRRDSRPESVLKLQLSLSNFVSGAAPLSPYSDGSAVLSPTPGDDAKMSSYMSSRSSRQGPTREDLRVHTINEGLTPPPSDGGASSESGKEEERQDREMFLSLEKPRIRYDVEVITKLVVYAGIAWLAVEGNPVLFDICGLT